MKKISGKELRGLEYEPIFPFFKDNKDSFQILEGDFVLAEEGTGIVHIAPAFGEDDFNLCRQNNIPFVCPVDDAGCFTEEVEDIKYELAGKEALFSVKGKQVFEGNDEIIKYIKGNNNWIKTEEYTHNYPHCWRTDTPLIYKVMPSWYVNVISIKDRMIEVNQSINWIPENIKNGIFGRWLENVKDWSISRNRFWGCPIPVWKSTDPQYKRTDVYGSIEELEKDFGDYYEKQHGKKLKITDLHRPFIDELTRPNPDDPTGKSMMVRTEDVLDCWFESGSMPFASIHYPFEYKVGNNTIRTPKQNQEWFHNHFPADFIVEYVAQTRGWFYTLVVLGVALFDKAPFLNCICHGVVLDDQGRKLSKRLNNYPNPLELFNIYGSDAMRFAMMRSAVMRGKEISIDVNGNFVKEASRGVISSLWNSFSFLKVYMESDGIYKVKNKKDAFYNVTSNNPIDIYILSELSSFIQSFKNALDSYDTVLACNLIEYFLELLNNWYIRRNKKRFWSSIKLDGSSYSYAIEKIEYYKTLNKEKLTDIATFSRENIVQNYQEGYKEYIESSIADAVLEIQERPWRISIDQEKKVVVIIDRDKQTAYDTLYSTILTFIRASAPLMPFITEKIYLDLTD